MKSLAIHLFGYPRLFLDGTEVKVARRKTLALAACLAVGESLTRSQRTPVGYSADPRSREAVATLLWPDCSQEQAAAYLRQSLWDFSKSAGEGWVDREGSILQLVKEDQVWVDVIEFLQLLEKANTCPPAEIEQALRRAVDLYQDDFMAGFSLRDSPAFDDWQSLGAETLRIRLGETLQQIVQMTGARREYDDAIGLAKRWLALDNLNEPAHREIMRLYEQSGQVNAALRQYEACRRILQDELAVPPEAATTALYQQMKAQRTSQITSPSRGGARTRTPVPAFLPRETTPMIGRESELAFLRERLANPETRLLTLIGPGGSGKTRLAVEAASLCIGFPYNILFTNGIYFVGLASASTPDQIIPFIAQALGFQFHLRPGQVLSAVELEEQIIQYLEKKEILLVLDNLEHLVEGAPLLSDLLAGAPGLRILATSRARLMLPEERVVEVGGLPYPENDRVADIQSYAAVQLFVKGYERAKGSRLSRAGKSGLSIPSASLPAVAQICRLLEGMPLGIELASSWSKFFSCDEIATKISASLDFLTSPAPKSSDPQISQRHHSLRAVFEHSWVLLDDIERGVLMRLAVFQGGFTREAALHVGGASLRTLSALVDQSLVRRVSSIRFDLHELIKQYAFEKLNERPQFLSDAHERHADYYCQWLLAMFEQMKGTNQASTLTALRFEQQNIRRIWRWLIEHEQFAWLEKVLPVTLLLYDMNGPETDGAEITQLLRDAITRVRYALLQKPGDPALSGCLALSLAGLRRFIMVAGREEESNLYQQESLALAHPLPLSSTRSYALALCAFGYSSLPEIDLTAVCEDSIAGFLALGDCFGAGLGYVLLADYYNFSRKDDARAFNAYQTGLDQFDQIGNLWGKALCLFGLAAIKERAGDYIAGYHYQKESMEINEQINNLSRAMLSRSLLADLAAKMGKKEEAGRYYEANLAYFIQVGDDTARNFFRQRIAQL